MLLFALSNILLINAQRTKLTLDRVLTEKTKPLMLDDFYKGQLEGSVESDDWAYYTLKFGDQVDQKLSFQDDDTDLVIEVQQDGDEFSDPNLYVNFDNTLPTLQRFNLRCSFYGEDFCVIGGKELFNKTELTIGIFCPEKCAYQLQAELTREFVVETGRSYRLYFLPNQERVVKFSIPDDPSIKSLEIKGYNENKFDRFNMIMTKGDQKPNSDNSLYLRPAWENGYVGKFEEDCSTCFCRGCNYTALIINEDKGGYITIGSKVSGQVVDLSTVADGQIYDSVLYQHTQCYEYQVVNETQDLKIKLESYAGDPDIYVNPLTKPDNLGMAVFNSYDHFQNEELILTPKMREEHNATKGLYYICIFGRTMATYRLTVRNVNSDHFLKSGLSESGYASEKEVKRFYFRDPIIAEEGVDIGFQMHAMTGKARLVGRLCQVSSDDDDEVAKSKCIITDEEMVNVPENETIMQHIGEEKNKTDTSVCNLPSQTVISNYRNAMKVSCIYTIAVVGLAPFKSHFSVMVKVYNKLDHIVLKEGVPAKDEILEAQPKYFMLSINDPNITKISIQLTTIHGDPDLFVSRTTKEPSYQNFERRSIRCGMFPEIVVYEKMGEITSLVGDYYVQVFGYVQSTFTLVYFTQNENNQTPPTVRLMSGTKQKGILKSTNDSMLYHFKLANDFNEDVEVRLHAENGRFMYYMGQGFIPTENNFTQVGTETAPIIYRHDNSSAQFTKYYILVKPVQFEVKGANQTQDSAGMAFIYTIAFYEQNSFIHLVEGMPIRGLTTNESFAYYYFDILDQTSMYEVVLTPIAGNPDLVISLNAGNKFPDKQANELHSEENAFNIDSIVITSKMLIQFGNKFGKNISQAYIGVYTQDIMADYTILVTKKKEFQPVLLQNGLIQSGHLDAGESKFYYFKTGSTMPIYATLLAKQGNPDLSIAVIKDLTMPMYKWGEKFGNVTDFISNERYNTEVIYLRPENQEFMNKCGASCILLFKVFNNNQTEESRYSLTVSRDMVELIENQQIQDYITDDGQYKYYLFNKQCDTCDLDIEIIPQQLSTPITLMVDYNVTSKLPTHNNTGKWLLNVNQQTTNLLIQSNDALFKGLNSKGQFVIAVHAHLNCSYFIKVDTFPHGQQRGVIQMRKVFLGETGEILLSPGQSKYVYFENWNNASLKLAYNEIQQKYNQGSIELAVVSLKSKKLPKTFKEIEQFKWFTNQMYDSKGVELPGQTKPNLLIQSNSDKNDIELCVQCLYLVRITNLRQDKDTKIRLIISQASDLGFGYTSNIMIGKPYTIKLSKNEKAILNFQLNEIVNDHVIITMSYFTGLAKISLDEGNRTTQLYPEQDLASEQLTVNDGSTQTDLIIKNTLQTGKPYRLVVQADSQDLHSSLIITSDDDLTIVPDGVPQLFNLTDPSVSITNKLFTYLPPSQRFQFAINIKVPTIGVHYNVYIKAISSKNTSQVDMPTRVLEGNISQEAHETPIPRKGPASSTTPKRSKFWSKYITWSSFDHTIRSTSFKDPSLAYHVVPIELKNDEDMIFVRLELIKGSVESAEYQITFTGSDIQFLLPGQTVRGHVSNRDLTYKIYEIYIDKENLFKDDQTDLYIEVIPCNGRVDYYVSSTYQDLFTKTTHQSSLQLALDDKFGRSSTRILNIASLPVVYIGVESSNEFFTSMKSQNESYFQISTQLLRSQEQDLTQTYQTGGEVKNGVIEVTPDTEDPDSFHVRWNKVFKRDSNAHFTEATEVTYQFYAGRTEDSLYQLTSMCAIEHGDHTSIFSIFINPDDYAKADIKLKRSDLEKVRAIGLVAKVRDPLNGQSVTLAYEPYSFKSERYGIKVESYMLVLIVWSGTSALFLLGVIIYCLRKKVKKLMARLDHEVNYVQNRFGKDSYVARQVDETDTSNMSQGI